MQIHNVPYRPAAMIVTLAVAALLGSEIAPHRVVAASVDAADARAGQPTPRRAAGERNRAQARAGEGADEPAGIKTGELVSMLDTYAIVEAQRALALEDDKYGQFVSRLKRLQEARRRSQRERNQIIQGLRRLIGPQAPTPVDEAVVRERLRALREHDERSAAEIRTAYDALDEILDFRQQARFRVFEETIERRKLDLLVRARERAARPGSR
jgi:hypothetical protein